jgi:hypothetical protein
MRYFAIFDRIESGFDPLVARFASIRRPGGCLDCGTFPMGCNPPDVKIANIARKAIVSSTTWGFGVIAQELLAFLGSETVTCLRLGNLVNSKGHVVSEFRTFVGIERVLLRGNQDSVHRFCKTCRALLYEYTPRDSPYVTSPQVASLRPLYEIEPMQLLVSEAVRDRIGDRWGEAIGFHDVPVLSSPLDGLPNCLSIWPTSSQLTGYPPSDAT